jgi:hypothetical protein
MKNSFMKIFRSHPKPVPPAVKDELHSHFPAAINVEWEIKKNYYEAIFYVEDVEHIAHISEDGILLEYKTNLWPADLPLPIAEKSREWGEIMNSIAITRKGSKFFEVIIRESNFKRKLLLFDESANLISSGKL